jgi:DtxR family Mn-dependent transcriptional regulator
MARQKSQLSESMEDYMEVILDLEKTHKVARTKDIAKKMGVQQGSVTGALKTLEEKGLINYKPYSFITLTKEGEKIAREVKRCHTVLTDFLYRVLQLDARTAEDTACRMEHTINKKSIDRLVQFIEFIDTCPRTGLDWVESFENYLVNKNLDPSVCESCIEKLKV